jgi:lipopolysaccharide transport system permease protein
MREKIQYFFDLIVVLTQKELKVRYKSSFLGYLWSIAQPLSLALVFFLAFKVVMRVQIEDYTLFLIAGLFPWQWFSNSLSSSPLAFLNNVSIIKKVNFPRTVIPLTVILQDMFHFLLSIPVIVLFLFIYGKSPSLSWIFVLPLLMGIQFLMIFGFSLLLSSVNLFFRDLERMASILLTLLFYFTPILYPETMIPKEYQSLLKFNPVAPLMMSWRNLFLTGKVDPGDIAVSFLYALAAFVLGYRVYKKLSWRFAEIL